MEAQAAAIADSKLKYKEVMEDGKVVFLLDDLSDIICVKYINLYFMEMELISSSHYEFELILSFWISYMPAASKVYLGILYGSFPLHFSSITTILFCHFIISSRKNLH